ATDHAKVSRDWNDVVRIVATVVDANGVAVPGASTALAFTGAGPVAIVATDNADSRSHESFQATTRNAFQGRAVAFVRATAPSGKITVTASALGLLPGSVSLTASSP